MGEPARQFVMEQRPWATRPLAVLGLRRPGCRGRRHDRCHRAPWLALVAAGVPHRRDRGRRGRSDRRLHQSAESRRVAVAGGDPPVEQPGSSCGRGRRSCLVRRHRDLDARNVAGHCPPVIPARRLVGRCLRHRLHRHLRRTCASPRCRLPRRPATPAHCCSSSSC